MTFKHCLILCLGANTALIQVIVYGWSANGCGYNWSGCSSPNDCGCSSASGCSCSFASDCSSEIGCNCGSTSVWKNVAMRVSSGDR